MCFNNTNEIEIHSFQVLIIVGNAAYLSYENVFTLDATQTVRNLT